eukprot:gene5911-8154_t
MSCDNRPIMVGYALNAKKLRKSSPSSSIKKNDQIHSKNQNLLSGSDVERKDNNKIIKDEICAETEVMTVKNWNGGGLADILLDYPQEGVQFLAWNHDVKLEEQPLFDVIIHKLTEDIDNKESLQKMKALEEYLLRYPKTIIIDPIDSVRNVISRARTCFHLEAIQNKSKSLLQPNYFVLDNFTSIEQVEQKLIDHHLHFPIICKPIQACGTLQSHSMIVIVQVEDLVLLQNYTPCVIQQYYDHDSVLYKVYVIDKEVTVFRRKSLPNLEQFYPLDSKNPILKSVPFDSRHNYPILSDFVSSSYANEVERNSPTSFISLPLFVCSSYDPTGKNAYSEELKINSVPTMKNLSHSSLKKLSKFSDNSELSDSSISLESFQNAANAIREEFGLTLFGFDAILPTKHDNFNLDHCKSYDNPIERPSEMGSSLISESSIFVIDVNFFPSYKEVHDFPSRLRKYLRSKATVT